MESKSYYGMDINKLSPMEQNYTAMSIVCFTTNSCQDWLLNLEESVYLEMNMYRYSEHLHTIHQLHLQLHLNLHHVYMVIMVVLHYLLQYQ